MKLRLNAFSLEYSADRFIAYRQDMPDPSSLKTLKERFGVDWFVYWKGGVAWGIPRIAQPKMLFGERVTVSTGEYEGLSLLCARTGDQLPSFLPKYEALPVRGRAFRFVAQKRELVAAAVKNWRTVPELLRQFEIRPQFTCECRLVELTEGNLQVVLVVGISMRWMINASLAQLKDSGVDLKGLYAVRRTRIPGQRSLIGRIENISGGEVFFDEAFDDLRSMPAGDVALEPSKMSFARCLKSILKGDYGSFWDTYERQQSAFLGGGSYDRCLEELTPALTKHKAIYIAEGIKVGISGRVHTDRTEKPREVAYCFDAAKTKQTTIPWAGLTKFGPYSRDSFPKRAPTVLVVCTDDTQSRVEQSIKKFGDGVPNSTFAAGFARHFHLNSVMFEMCPVPLRTARGSLVAETFADSVERHLQKRNDYDSAIVVVPDQLSELPDEESPYLFAKAKLLTNGIPVQEARLSTLSRPDQSLQYIFQNFAVALYAKMGGIPWTVNQDQTVSDEVVVGMGLVETSGSRFEERQRFVGITTVFRGDGNYLLSNVSRESRFSEYQEELRKTMISILSEIKERNGWRKGDAVRVVFHASKPLRDIEVDQLMYECVSEAAPEQNVQFAFLTVLQDHPFKVFDTSQTGKRSGNSVKGEYVPARGTSMQLGKNTWLVCTNGLAQIKRVTTPLPSPLLIHLHNKSTGCDLPYLTDQVLKFTSLTWRSTHPAPLPVTIYYSELIAGLLVRLRSVPGWSPNVLNTKLRASKWFL